MGQQEKELAAAPPEDGMKGGGLGEVNAGMDDGILREESEFLQECIESVSCDFYDFPNVDCGE